MLPYIMTTFVRSTATGTLYITLPKTWNIKQGSQFKVKVVNHVNDTTLYMMKRVASRGTSTVIFIPKNMEEHVRPGDMVNMYLEQFEVDETSFEDYEAE